MYGLKKKCPCWFCRSSPYFWLFLLVGEESLLFDELRQPLQEHCNSCVLL